MSSKRLTIFFVLFLLGSVFKVAAQSIDDCNKKLYQAFITSDISEAKGVVEDLEQFYISNKTIEALYYLTYAQQALLGNDLTDKYFELLYDKARENAENLLEVDTLKSFGHAFLAGIYASQMGRSTVSAMFLAPKNKNHLKMALEADENNPIAWMQYGGFKFYAPGFFGGYLDDAIEALEKSIYLFEEYPSELYSNWDYLGTLNLLRHSYRKAGREAEALAIKDKARGIEPRLRWVKN